jgi:hypothetical protein
MPNTKTTLAHVVINIVSSVALFAMLAMNCAIGANHEPPPAASRKFNDLAARCFYVLRYLKNFAGHWRISVPA